MTEGRTATAVVDGHLDERLLQRTLKEAADASPPDLIRTALEMAVDIAELDPKGARTALWSLRGNQVEMEHLEAHLEMSADRATLALGAAIQLASAELASPRPDMRSRMPELRRWLEGSW